MKCFYFDIYYYYIDIDLFMLIEHEIWLRRWNYNLGYVCEFIKHKRREIENTF